MAQLASPLDGERGLKRKELTDEEEDESGSPKSELSSAFDLMPPSGGHSEVCPGLCVTKGNCLVSAFGGVNCFASSQQELPLVAFCSLSVSLKLRGLSTFASDSHCRCRIRLQVWRRRRYLLAVVLR